MTYASHFIRWVAGGVGGSVGGHEAKGACLTLHPVGGWDGGPAGVEDGAGGGAGDVAETLLARQRLGLGVPVDERLAPSGLCCSRRAAHTYLS